MVKNTPISDVILQFSHDLDVIDIEMIIAFILEKDRVFVMTHSNTPIPEDKYNTIVQLCEKRKTGYPLAYIIGQKDFFGRKFFVSEQTLVPRSETELIISSVIENIEKQRLNDILLCDIGTGSGIIPITLKKELEKRDVDYTIVASDISEHALEIAKKNIDHYNIRDIRLYNTSLINDNILETISKTKKQNIIITANLPYVDTKKRNVLFAKKESIALKHEPAEALWSEDGGMKHYKKLIQQITILHEHVLKEKSISSFYEIDPDQSTTLQEYITERNPRSQVFILKDLADKERVVQWHA